MAHDPQGAVRQGQYMRLLSCVEPRLTCQHRPLGRCTAAEFRDGVIHAGVRRRSHQFPPEICVLTGRRWGRGSMALTLMHRPTDAPCIGVHPHAARTTLSPSTPP